ncbi:MAG: tetratricopeptide repeat protein [Nitrospirae bacterium]|nr:tetratricopeptide repeat protein [Nitrospirota bacterium]
MRVPRPISVYPRIVLAALAMLGVAAPLGAAEAFLHTEVVLRVTEAVNFEMVRAVNGTEVEVRIDSPPDTVTPLAVAEDDPLVAGMTLEPDATGTGTRVRVFLREHAVRSATQTLERPFRVVLDLVHDLPTAPVATPEAETAPAPASPSPFALHVPVELTQPPLAIPVAVSGPATGPGADVFSAAHTAYDRKQWDAAATGFERFLAEHPDSPLAEAAAYLAADLKVPAAWPLGPPARAEVAKQYDALVKRFPRSPNLPTALVRMAEVLVAESKWEDAKPLVETVRQDYVESPAYRGATLLRGQIALGQNHVHTALANFTEVRDGGTGDADGTAATFGLAETMVRMGRYPEAVSLYQEAVTRAPGRAKGDIHQLKLMGRALMEAGRFLDARQVFLILYNVFPSHYPSSVALSQVADTFRGEGRWELAERRYTEVIALYPKSEGSLTARMSLADLYVDRQRSLGKVDLGPVIGGDLGRAKEDELLAEALKLYGEVVRIAPSDALSEEAIYKSALLHADMGDDLSALAKAGELVTRNPKTHWRTPARELAEDVLAHLATDLVAKGQAAKAISTYREYEPALFTPALRGWRAHYPLALANESLGLNRDAMRHFLSLLGSQAPDEYRARALYRLGGLYLRMGQPEQALKRFGYYTRRYPHGPNADTVHLRIAQTHAVMGNLGRAADAYDRYLSRFARGPERRDTRLAAAALRQRLEEPERARDLYLEVLADDARQPDPARVPTSAQVRLRLADLEYGLDRYGAAQAAYEAALADGLKGDNRSWAELRRGQAAVAGGDAEGRELLSTLAQEGTGTVMSSVAREIAGSPE